MNVLIHLIQLKPVLNNVMVGMSIVTEQVLSENTAEYVSGRLDNMLLLQQKYKGLYSLGHQWAPHIILWSRAAQLLTKQRGTNCFFPAASVRRGRAVIRKTMGHRTQNFTLFTTTLLQIIVLLLLFMGGK